MYSDELSSKRIINVRVTRSGLQTFHRDLRVQKSLMERRVYFRSLEFQRTNTILFASMERNTYEITKRQLRNERVNVQSTRFLQREWY